MLKMRTIETTLEHIAHAVADEYRLECDIKWTQGFQANENDETQSSHQKAVKENQFELMEDNPLLGRRFRFIYPTLSRCHVWAGIRNSQLYTILTTIFQTILLRLEYLFSTT
jgi:metal-dependent amidase/aminoacylase/carboxypeptidase family protein